AKLQYLGTEGGVSHYNVDYLHGADTTATVLLRLRSVLRQAHPGATDVRVTMVPSHPTIARLAGMSEADLAAAKAAVAKGGDAPRVTVTLPLQRKAIPALFRPKAVEAPVAAAPRTIGAVPSKVEHVRVMEFDNEGRVLFQEEIAGQIKHVDFTTK